jgi:hypothetical protein
MNRFPLAADWSRDWAGDKFLEVFFFPKTHPKEIKKSWRPRGRQLFYS